MVEWARSARCMVLGCVGLGLAAVSCGTDDGNNKPRVGPPNCYQLEGTQCMCAGGQLGTSRCVDGVDQCDCPVCPAVEMRPPPSAASCGGEPFGLWRLKHVELGPGGVQMRRPDGYYDPVACAAMFEVDQSQPPKLLMAIKDGGELEVVFTPAPVTVRWSASCARRINSAHACSSSASNGTCTLDCDTCTCVSESWSELYNSAEWSRSNSKLNLSMWGSSEYDYCVANGELTMSSPTAYVVFERVTGVGQPEPCAARSSDKCAGYGCSKGGCLGGVQCSASTNETECLTLQGCYWEPTLCHGEVPDSCAITDYEVTPGCKLEVGAYECIGTPDPCGGRTDSECNAGCEVSPVGHCEGGTTPCRDFSACPIGWCDWDELYGCTGTVRCSDRGWDNCEELNEEMGANGCTWFDYTCTGTPAPCSSYDAQSCESTTGCKLELKL